MNNPTHIPTMEGDQKELKMTVEYISFSAHSDYQQTEEFIDILQPPHIVCYFLLKITCIFYLLIILYLGSCSWCC